MLPSTLPGTLSRTLPIALDGTLPGCLTVRSQASSQDALKHTPSTLSNTLPIAPDDTLPACLTIRSQVHSEYAPKYTSEYALKCTPGHALKDAPNCTRLHTPRLLDCTLSSTLRIALDYTLPACLTVRSQVRSQESRRSQSHLTICCQVCSCLLDADCRCQILGGVWQAAYCGLCLAGGVWRAVCGGGQLKS